VSIIVAFYEERVFFLLFILLLKINLIHNSYQDQKVHLFRPSLGFLVEAQPRLENRHFLAEVHITFFRRLHELQNKRYLWKNYKFILYNYLLFSNRYIY
jgi:hypothetical protein